MNINQKSKLLGIIVKGLRDKVYKLKIKIQILFHSLMNLRSKIGLNKC